MIDLTRVKVLIEEMKSDIHKEQSGVSTYSQWDALEEGIITLLIISNTIKLIEDGHSERLGRMIGSIALADI